MRKLFVLALVIMNFGCATMSDVIKNKNNGTAKTYPVSEDDAYKIARQVFRWEGTDAIEERRDENMLLTSSSMGLFTLGTFMGVWVEPVDAENTTVTAVTKRKLATNLVTSLTERTFHKRFAQAVELLKAGRSLPISAPRMESTKRTSL